MKRLLGILMLVCAGCNAEMKPNAAAGPELEQLRTDVYWLADDARAGRYPGTPGAEAAATYIEQRFFALGLKPLSGLGTYRQTFTLPGEASIGTDTFLHIGASALQLNRDFVPLSFGNVGRFEAKMAFVGYGISSTKLNYDDYAGIDVTGRVVLAMRYEPHNTAGKSRFTGAEFTEAAAIVAKAQTAFAKGAKALLLVNPPVHHSSDAPLRTFEPRAVRTLAAPIPIVSITPEVAQRLMGDQQLGAIQECIDTSGAPASFVRDDIAVAGSVDLPVARFSTSNIVGVLPGIGPTAGEYVVVGAHYDHLGTGHEGSLKPESREIHNGADDNASGVAAVMAMARRLANHRLERTVIFVCFTGEESGLHGSRHFVNDSRVPVDRIVAMINLDMVGRAQDNNLLVGGGGTRASFRDMLRNAEAQSALHLVNINPGGYGPSDHESFAIKRIPVLFFMTRMHEQYHRPEDDANLLNYPGLVQVTDFATAVVEQIAAAPREQYVDAYDGNSISHTTLAAATQPASGGARASLGVVPDYSSEFSAAGVRISAARPHTPAAEAGLRDGDVLIGFGDQKIANLYDLTRCLRDARPGESVEIRYVRGGKSESVRVRLTQRTGVN